MKRQAGVSPLRGRVISGCDPPNSSAGYAGPLQEQHKLLTVQLSLAPCFHV